MNFRPASSRAVRLPGSSGQSVWLDRAVQHENVDKDPDLRKSSDLEHGGKSKAPLLIAVGAVSAVVTAVILIIIHWSSAWGPSQWGDVATWLAGIATSAAVAVAVWQTDNANKQARAAEKRAELDVKAAERRSETQLRQSERQHQEQLTYARQQAEQQRVELLETQQILAVERIVTASNRAHNAAAEFLLRMSRPVFVDPADLDAYDRIISNRARFISEINDASVEVTTQLAAVRDPALLDVAMDVRDAVEALKQEFTGDANEAVRPEVVEERQTELHAKKVVLIRNLAAGRNPVYLDVLGERVMKRLLARGVTPESSA